MVSIHKYFPNGSSKKYDFCCRLTAMIWLFRNLPSRSWCWVMYGGENR